MNAQGWYQDPFRVHDLRWFSEGRPTNLVRDGAIESHDEPPSSTYEGPLVEAAAAEAHDGTDLQRADEPLVDRNYVRAAIEAATQAGWNFN